MTNILVAWVQDLGDLLKCLFCEPAGSGPMDPSNPSVGQEKVLITNVSPCGGTNPPILIWLT